MIPVSTWNCLGTFMYLLLLGVAGCACLPIDTHAARQSAGFFSSEIELNEDGRVHIRTELLDRILNARGTVTFHVAFYNPRDYFLEGPVAQIYVNGEERGVLHYLPGQSGRRDVAIEITPYLLEGTNTIEFKSFVIKCPFGGNAPSTKVARVATDESGVIVPHQCSERTDCGYSNIHETWEIDWSK